MRFPGPAQCMLWTFCCLACLISYRHARPARLDQPATCPWLQISCSHPMSHQTSARGPNICTCTCAGAGPPLASRGASPAGGAPRPAPLCKRLPGVCLLLVQLHAPGSGHGRGGLCYPAGAVSGCRHAHHRPCTPGASPVMALFCPVSPCLVLSAEGHWTRSGASALRHEMAGCISASGTCIGRGCRGMGSCCKSCYCQLANHYLHCYCRPHCSVPGVRLMQTGHGQQHTTLQSRV